MTRHGFTLIEILIAMLIFALSIFAITQSRTMSLRNVKESHLMFEGTQLAESKMNELQMKYQSKIDRDGIEPNFGTDEGDFEEPHKDFHWKSEFRESTIKFTREILEQFLVSLGVEKDKADEQANAQALILANLNKMIVNNYGELYVVIEWKEFGKRYSIPLITHIIPAHPKIELTTVGEE